MEEAEEKGKEEGERERERKSERVRSVRKDGKAAEERMRCERSKGDEIKSSTVEERKAGVSKKRKRYVWFWISVTNSYRQLNIVTESKLYSR